MARPLSPLAENLFVLGFLFLPRDALCLCRYPWCNHASIAWRIQLAVLLMHINTIQLFNSL